MRGMGHPEVVHLVMHKPKLIELYVLDQAYTMICHT